MAFVPVPKDLNRVKDVYKRQDMPDPERQLLITARVS